MIQIGKYTRIATIGKYTTIWRTAVRETHYDVSRHHSTVVLGGLRRGPQSGLHYAERHGALVADCIFFPVGVILFLAISYDLFEREC